MGDAFEWLDAEFSRAARGSDLDIDPANDWIFMMKTDDWSALEKAWSERPPRWRENCAYILGLGPAPESRLLLRQGLFDQDEDVALQAALSLCGHALDEPKLVVLDEVTLDRLEYLHRKHGPDNLEEVVEVLSRHRP